MEKLNIYQKLFNIQTSLKAPKDKKNSFGNYEYRSYEGILEAVKPLLKENHLVLTCNDAIQGCEGRFYIKAELSLKCVESGEQITTTAYAREALEKKGMDAAQITGAASSYARKYAANAMFAIDDVKDSDTDEYQNTSNNSPDPAAPPEPKPYSGKQTTSTDPASDKQKATLDKFNVAYEPGINKTEASKLLQKAFADADAAREEDRSEWEDRQ